MNFLKIKKIVAKNFSSFAYFYSYLKHKILITVVLSIIVGVLDGFGLAMFLPLLSFVSNAEEMDTESLGNLSFLVEGFSYFGIPLSLISVLVVMIIFFALKGIAAFVGYSYRIIIQQQFVRDMRLKMLSSLNKISFKDFVTSDAGRIQNTMTGEVERVTKAFASYFLAFEQSILVVVYMTFALFVDFQFAILVIIGGASTNFIYKLLYKKTKEASKSLTSNSHQYQGEVIQHVANYKYLRATGLIYLFEGRLGKTIFAIEADRKKMGVYSAILRAAREPILVFVVAAVILIQAFLLEGDLGGIMLSLLFFYRALSALVGMQTAWNFYLESYGALENVIDFQNKLEKRPEKNGVTKIGKFENNIEIRNVSLSYGEKTILHNINLDIKKKESVAFVGESGSGKTTLVNMVAGLLPPDKGKMLIDSIPYEQLDKTTLQNQVGYITQEPVVFNDSIYNNVTFWEERTPENEDRFKRAIKKAALENFLNDLPEKEETLLGNNGINLSGGQKQRISIARELYKDIEILILDEATSALDSETEKSIQANIESLKGEYTLLIVAHRLSTIKNVDKVVLMNNGKIENVGTFEELVTQKPSFRRMVELQEL